MGFKHFMIYVVLGITEFQGIWELYLDFQGLFLPHINVETHKCGEHYNLFLISDPIQQRLAIL